MRVNPGSTNVSVYFYIVQDASATSPGEPVTGLLFSDIETGGSASYARQGAARVDLTLITLASASAAHADGGFILVDDTNMPGVYRCDYADATFASGVDQVTLSIVVASAKNAVASPIYVDISTDTVTDAIKVVTDKFAFTVANQVDANALAISGDTTAADNLEATYDGTGYTDDNAPAKQSQVTNISTVGAAVHVSAIASPGGFVLTTGSEVNTEDATVALDGTKHELTDAAGTLDGLYKFTIGGDAAPVSVTFTGNFNSNNDSFNIFGNTGTDGTPVWVQLGTIEGVNSTSNTVHTFNMFNNMIVTDVAGQVQVRVQATGLTSSSFDVDQVFVSKSDTSRSVGYANGRIFLNTNANNTSTESFVDGVADNPVSTIAAVKTLATNVGLSDIHAINGSSFTLAENSDNESYFGDNYSLALGGQSCAEIYIQGASVSGIGTSATGHMHFEGCEFGIASIQSGHLDFCAFADTITHTLAGDYNYHNCYSMVAGAGSSVFTKTAGQVITAQWRNWSGSITVSTIEASDVMTIGGRLGTVTLNGADGTVEIRGTYKEIVDNRTGSPTLNLDGAIKGSDVAATPKAVWDRIISKANHDIGQSAGKILRQSGDLVQIDGAVSDVSPATTGFDTNLTQPDGYFEDAVMTFSNGAANAGIGQPISTYLNANGAVTFDAPDDWPVTPVNGDDFVIQATHIHPVGQIADAVLDEILSGHTTAGSLGKAVADIETDATAIKAKTDDLTYTKANELDINIQSVNDVTVNGTGASGDEWGP